jgi:hypothetical protein
MKLTSTWQVLRDAGMEDQEVLTDHIELQMDFWLFSVTFFVGTPLCPYGIAYRRVYGLVTFEAFNESL